MSIYPVGVALLLGYTARRQILRNLFREDNCARLEALIIVKPDTIGSWLLCDRTQAADEFSTSTPRRTQLANGSYRNCARLSRGSAVSFVRMLRFEHLAR
jgi:hypothetical protein